MTPPPDGPAVRGRIIRAATALFSRRGYYATGTREIARLADISEVTLFRYFDHKEDVFDAALRASFQSVESRLNLLSRGVEGKDPEEALPKIIRLLVDITTFSPELVKLVGVAVLELRGKYRDMCCGFLAPLFTGISSYLSCNIEQGKIRNLNPAILTAAMTLTVLVRPELSQLIENSQVSDMNDRQTIEAFSSFWTTVLIPQTFEGSTNSVL